MTKGGFRNHATWAVVQEFRDNPKMKAMAEGWVKDCEKRGLNKCEAKTEFTYRLDDFLDRTYDGAIRMVQSYSRMCAELMPTLAEADVDYDAVCKIFLRDYSPATKAPQSKSVRSSNYNGRRRRCPRTRSSAGSHPRPSSARSATSSWTSATAS